MEIKLNEKQLNEIARQKIEALEKENKSLKRKLSNRDNTIANLRRGMDVTKGRRKQIRDLARSLVESLEDAKWVDRHDEVYRAGGRC